MKQLDLFDRALRPAVERPEPAAGFEAPRTTLVLGPYVVDWQHTARAEVERLYALAETLWSQSFERPAVCFDIKGKCLAGQANIVKNALRFNLAMLLKYGQEFITDTVVHEVAHLVTRALCRNKGRRIRPHGPEWAKVMRRLGGQPKRTHNFTVPPARRTRTFPYRCNCREWPLGPKRHALAQSGRGKYRCPRCHGPLRFADA